MGKKPNLNHARNMDVDAWRERQITKTLQRLLEERERQFRLRYGQAADRELREYLIDQARALGRMPHPLELEGGTYLRERLGDWAALSRSLGYCPPGKRQERQAMDRLREQAAETFARERRALKQAKSEKR